VLIVKICEIIIIVLILRALISLALGKAAKTRRADKPGAAVRYKEKGFDKSRMDIVDGEYKDLK
jgi:hypothetical protein